MLIDCTPELDARDLCPDMMTASWQEKKAAEVSGRLGFLWASFLELVPGRIRFLVGAGSAFWGAWCLVLWVSSLELFFPQVFLFGVGSLFGAGLSMDIQRGTNSFSCFLSFFSFFSFFWGRGWGWGEATCVLLCSCSEPIFHCGVSRDSKLEPRWVWFLALSLDCSSLETHRCSQKMSLSFYILTFPHFTRPLLRSA